MPFIVEDGTGHSQANAYAGVQFVLDYLTDRNRQDENGWADLDLAVKQAHIIAATQYIEARYGLAFKGRKFYTSLTQAVGVLTLTANAISNDTITIGSTVYVFKGSLAAPFEVLIGANIQESLVNFVNAVLATPSEAGVTHGTGTTVHPDAVSDTFETDQSSTHAIEGGSAGNAIATTTTIAGASWSATTLTGGVEVGRPQPLSFPRSNLFDRDGLAVVGMPEKLKHATCEYAVRSAGSVLLPDPDFTTGLTVVEKEEVVGPIKERTKWQEGGRLNTLVSYPAADRLLEEYIETGGLVLRG